MESFLSGFADIIITIFNYLIAGVGIVISFLLSIFPNSPFAEPMQPPELVNLSYIAWFIPYVQMVQHAILLCTAIIVYYGIRVLARWIKMVRS